MFEVVPQSLYVWLFSWAEVGYVKQASNSVVDVAFLTWLSITGD